MCYLILCCLLFFCSALDDDNLPCDSFDESNCGLYYCVVNDGNCVVDSCFEKNESECVGDLDCRLVTLDFDNNFEGTPSTFCVKKTNHFSDCALTVEKLESLYNGDNNIIAEFENYCETLKCGGLINIEEKDATENEGQHFYCDEKGGDGTLNGEDFDANNCKLGYQFIVKDGKCVYDECLPEDPEDCPDTCLSRHVGEGDLCISNDRPVTTCSETFNHENVTIDDDYCINSAGCGERRSVRSKRGNTYYYCSEKEPPPRKNSALSLRVPFIVAIVIFTLFI